MMREASSGDGMVYSEQALRETIRKLRARRLSEKQALARIKNLPYETFRFARVDHHRVYRKGFPEVVYAPGKTPAQIARVASSILKSGQPLLVTRVEPELYRKLKRRIPSLAYSGDGRVAYSGRRRVRTGASCIAVLTAGTSDIPVAEEAAVTLEIMGRPVARLYDCGVAAIHRLFDRLNDLKKARAIICVAGMEGALASVVAGLVDKPVIAVPTSVGYGASFRGLAPLLTMINSCSQGVALVNIDNGFGAACFASMIT